jgi:hypothetical protein
VARRRALSRASPCPCCSHWREPWRACWCAARRNAGVCGEDAPPDAGCSLSPQALLRAGGVVARCVFWASAAGGGCGCGCASVGRARVGGRITPLQRPQSPGSCPAFAKQPSQQGPEELGGDGTIQWDARDSLSTTQMHIRRRHSLVRLTSRVGAIKTCATRKQALAKLSARSGSSRSGCSGWFGDDPSRPSSHRQPPIVSPILAARTPIAPHLLPGCPLHRDSLRPPARSSQHASLQPQSKSRGPCVIHQCDPR